MIFPKEMRGGGYGNGRKPKPPPAYHKSHPRMRTKREPIRIPWLWIIILAPLALGIFKLLTM